MECGLPGSSLPYASRWWKEWNPKWGLPYENPNRSHTHPSPITISVTAKKKYALVVFMEGSSPTQWRILHLLTVENRGAHGRVVVGPKKQKHACGSGMATAINAKPKLAHLSFESG